MKEQLLEILSKLISVKSIVTFALVYTVCRLALMNNIVISEEVFIGIVMAVITYYFTRADHTKKGK